MAHRRRANKCRVIPHTQPPWARERKKTPLTDWGIKGLDDLECMGVIRGRTRSVGTIFFIQVLGKI